MKLIKNNTVFVIMFMVSLSVSAQSELDNYLQTAAENNPGLKAKFSEYMAALEKVPQAGALPDPTVAFGYFVQPVETRTGPQQFRAGISQMFPWFGTLGTQEDVAAEMAKSRYEMFEEARSGLFFDVKSAWYNLYFTDRAIAVTLENIEILNTFQKLALVKIETGKATAVDELRVEMEILDLENRLKSLYDKHNSQKITFNNLLNVDEQRQVLLPELLKEEELSLDRDAITDSIRLSNHQVLDLEFQEASYSYQQIAARKMGKPKFTISMDYIFIGGSSNAMLSAGESGKDAVMFPMAGISVPLYRKKYTSMKKEAVFMLEAVRNRKADKINTLESVYGEANTGYQDARRRIELNTGQLELAKKALRILESEYATNGSNFEELLRMEQQVLKYSLELEKARTDLNVSVAFINYLMGK
ncbi:MAG: TolC family protein [Bacteroidales bacterium]|nr:TolC family protein [Bacteroidales bacterium]